MDAGWVPPLHGVEWPDPTGTCDPLHLECRRADVPSNINGGERAVGTKALRFPVRQFGSSLPGATHRLSNCTYGR